MPLEYDVAYHVHSELELGSGRKISLRQLEQTLTYAGWLEGTPTRSINDAELDTALADARSKGGTVAAHLLPPRRRDYLRTPGDMAGHHPFGPPEWLPVVRCIALFRSFGSPDGGSWSALRLVWFQDEFALPISDDALASIRSLDWDALATPLTG